MAVLVMSIKLDQVFSFQWSLYLKSTVNCTWATWNAWGSCSVTCGAQGGTQQRTRVVAAPAENGGAACNPINATEARNCSNNGCPGNAFDNVNTGEPAYSDTFRTREYCHCK